MAEKTKHLSLTALFAAVLALSAFLRIPAGPVPLTLQSTAALLCGYCLGGRLGAASTVLYTGVGLAGLPVFAAGGGPAYLISPTFGYIIGFTAGALVAGILARFNTRGSVSLAYAIMMAGVAAIYIPGVLWLYTALRLFMGAPAPVASILRTGLIIPLIGDLLKTIPAALIGVKLRPVVQRMLATERN